MAAWITAFGVQAYLGAAGRIVQHKRAGQVAFAIGWLAWASMVFVEWRAMIVHPLPDDPAGYDEILPGPYVYLAFPLFLAWAYHERRRPMWHKRLMLFALFLSLTAAAQRYSWLPMYHSRAGYWAIAAFIDIALLGPVIAFDLVTLRGRLHDATLRGMIVLLAIQALILSLWGTPLWRGFAQQVNEAVHQSA